MTNDPYNYHQDGKREKGLHEPITCPFCGPKPGDFVPESDYLQVEVEKNVTFKSPHQESIVADVTFCAKCGRVLSLTPRG